MNKSAILLSTITAVTCIFATPTLRAAEEHEHDAATPAAMSGCCHSKMAQNKTAESAATPLAAEPAKPAAKPYTLDTCIVSGEKLGEMGKPVVFEYNGQEIKLCCKACRKKFDKDPATYLKKLEPKK